jgi:hypothetical protein
MKTKKMMIETELDNCQYCTSILYKVNVLKPSGD